MCARFMRGYLLLALVALAALTACGDNGGAGTNTAGGGIGGTGISVGVITARQRPTATATAAVASGASITVSGVTFALNSSTVITKDGWQATFDEVHKGMIAEVRGLIEGDQGVAYTVSVDDAVRGVVENDPVDNKFVVAGQTVLVDDTTNFNPFNPLSPKKISEIHQGDLLDIYGLVKGPGTVKAMYFERRMPPSVIKVRGLIQNFDQASMTFDIGGLTVSYAGATNVPAGIRNDLFVEVHGNCTGTPVCGTLNATTIEIGKLGLDDAEWAHIEGFVTTVTPAWLFTVGDQPVLTDGTTRFAGGEPSDIIRGARVEVEGSLVGGVVHATKVVFEDGIQIEGNVATVGTDTLTIAGLPGVVINVDDQTDFEGGAARDLSSVSGGNVSVRGRMDPNNNPNAVLATELDLRSSAPDTAVVLQGPAQVIVPETSVTILGVAANTAGVNFIDAGDNPVNAIDFYSVLHMGELVKVKGDLATGSSVTWREIEIEE